MNSQRKKEKRLYSSEIHAQQEDDDMKSPGVAVAIARRTRAKARIIEKVAFKEKKMCRELIRAKLPAGLLAHLARLGLARNAIQTSTRKTFQKRCCQVSVEFCKTSPVRRASNDARLLQRFAL